jgi:site-specific recombinase XerD
MDSEQLEEFGGYLINELQLSEKTVTLYLIYARLFEPLKISQEYINKFILKHNNSEPVRAFVKNYLEHLRIYEMFTLPQRPRGRRPQKIIRSITPEELKTTKEYFYSFSYKTGLLFELMYQGALRRAEIPTITIGNFFWIEWINNPNDFLKLLIYGKGKKQRMVLINSETAQKFILRLMEINNIPDVSMLKDFLINNKDAHLFTNTKGEKISEREVWKIIKENSKKAIGRDIRPHEIRHYRATDLEKRGVPIRDIRNYLGHSKLATTELYLHKSGEESIDTIKKHL